MAQRKSSLDAATVSEFISSTSLFKTCDAGLIDKIAPHIEAWDYDKGDVVFRAGGNGGQLGLVFAGSASQGTVDPASGQVRESKKLSIGDCFGELSAVMGTPQQYQIVAASSCTSFLVPKVVVGQLCSKVAGFSHALAKRLGAQVTKNGLLAASNRDVAMPPAASSPREGGAGEDTIEFVRAGSFEPNEQLAKMLPVNVMQKFRLLPLGQRDGRLVVGMSTHSVGRPALNFLGLFRQSQ